MADQLDLRDLRYFEAIAACGHVGRAARSLHRSQPTLTGAVRRLEEKLGTALFEKAGRGIRLTAAGEALHSRSRALRIAADDAEREVADIGRGNAGLVRIGLAPTAARFLLPSLTREFLRASPSLCFRTIIANNDVLRAALRSGEFDLTVNLAHPGDEDIESHDIATDDCVVVAGRRHPIFRRRPAMRDLARYGWLLGGPTVATREWLERVFRDHGLPPPKVRIETNSVLFMPTLAEHNDLLSFISRRHLASSPGLKEVRIRATTMLRRFALCYRRNSYLSPAAQRVIEALRRNGESLFGPREDPARPRKGRTPSRRGERPQETPRSLS